MNIRLDIEYDGEPYHGWQMQKGVPTVQEEIEKVVTRIVGQRCPLQGASRTDAGVHALQQVANFKTSLKLPPQRWRIALNTQLPPTIRIVRSFEVADEFNSTKHAIRKTYRYDILNREFASALERRVCFCPKALDFKSIEKAMRLFCGTHDFRAFEGKGSERLSTLRTIYSFTMVERKKDVYSFFIEGNGFLKHMVRIMVGTLLEIGEGKRNWEDVRRLTRGVHRREAGRTAPADALTLMSLIYAPAYENPQEVAWMKPRSEDWTREEKISP